jgi:hypothetical protein
LKRVSLYHAIINSDLPFKGAFGIGESPAWPDGYELVAHLSVPATTARDVASTVFAMSQNMDEGCWITHPDVSSVPPGKERRSTSVWDVVVIGATPHRFELLGTTNLVDEGH